MSDGRFLLQVHHFISCAEAFRKSVARYSECCTEVHRIVQGACYKEVLDRSVVE